jgi:hypothetical protein
MTKTNRSFTAQQNLLAAAAIAASVLLSSVAGAKLPESCFNKWNDPALQKRTDDGIEKTRKSDVELTIADAGGKPVARAEVKVAQESQEFLFGAKIFVLGQMKEKEQAYREAFLQLFNAATAVSCWRGTKPEQYTLLCAEGGEDIWRSTPADRVVAFAKEQGLTLRGHPLLWYKPTDNPTWLPKDPGVLKDLYRQRLQQIAERYADDIPIRDVVNESQDPAGTRGAVFPLSVAEEGEALQVQVVRDMYCLWFSVPKMAGITWWNLGNGMAHGKEGLGLGGLTDENIKSKLAYRALDQLINHDWKTNLQTRSDGDGKMSFRGFHGGYKVTVTADGQTKGFEVKAGVDGVSTQTLTMS